MWSICIHGGAGNISRERPVRLEVAELRMALRRAVAVVKKESQGVLRQWSPTAPTALVAAVEAVLAMEDSIYFNAGRGSCLNTEGKCEMEAAVMVGGTLSNGACCGVKRVKNAILLAEHIRVNTPHTCIGFEAAEKLAEQAGMEMRDAEWFIDANRLRQQERAAVKKEIVRDHDIGNTDDGPSGDTVGAVVLDAEGNLAGAVSTGGTTNKYVGRIGDSPCIGAGMYATPLAAVCGTGTGERFVESNSCAQICHAMKYGNLSLKEAVDHVLIKEMPGDAGGIIAVDANGNVVTQITAKGMFRGTANSNGLEEYSIWEPITENPLGS